MSETMEDERKRRDLGWKSLSHKKKSIKLICESCTSGQNFKEETNMVHICFISGSI